MTFDSMDRTLKCDHSLEKVEHYFTVALFVKPLTPRVKSWLIQRFLTFESNLPSLLFWKIYQFRTWHCQE